MTTTKNEAIFSTLAPTHGVCVALERLGVSIVSVTVHRGSSSILVDYEDFRRLLESQALDDHKTNPGRWCLAMHTARWTGCQVLLTACEFSEPSDLSWAVEP